MSEKRQCIYINKNEKQCKNNEYLHGTWLCNTHINKLYNLKLGKSAIKGAGTGLFAGKEGFKKGHIIGEYSRYDVKMKESIFNEKCKKDKSHKCSEYVYCDNTKSCWDARYTPSIIVRYSNDTRSKKNNATFENIGGRSFMLATKKIAPEDEIFCDYGDDYDWSFLDE